MSTSWRSPFPILPAPHTTPVSTKSKSLRRPIHNPYDKFTKQEFDEWIGDITGALRRALGDETEEDVALDERQSQNVHAASDETFQDQSFEDSFADIQSRRAKGKAKDPREGPGLSTPQNPIELLSDSGSGSEAGSDEYDNESLQGEEEYENYAERQEGDGFGVDVERDVSDGRDQARQWTLSGRRGPVSPEVEEDEVVEISSREESPEIIDVGSDGEGDTPAYVHGVGYSDAQYDCSPRLPPDDLEDELGPGDIAANEEESQSDAEVEDFPPDTQRPPSLPIDLPDPWQGPRTYAEDFYAGGDFSAQEIFNSVSPSSLTPVHDAYVDSYFSNKVQDDKPPQQASKAESVVSVDVVDTALPDSSPPPSSPIEERSDHHHTNDNPLLTVRNTHEEPDNILDHLYRDAVQMSQDEQQMILNSSFDEFNSSVMSNSQAHPQHLDWNWPPAFPRGKFASRAGHLESPPLKAEVDDVEEAHEDIIDIDAERNEEEEDDEALEGPIPLGTSDLVHDDDVHQGENDEFSNGRDEELVEGDDIQVSDDNRFLLPAESRLSVDERVAMESFFDLLNSTEVSPLEHVDTALADISGIATDPIDPDVTRSQGIEEADDKYFVSVPSEVLESVNEESQVPYPAEPSPERTEAPSVEIQDQSQNVTSENTEEWPLPSTAPSSALDDTPLLAEEQPDIPNAESMYIVVEMEDAVPVSRGVSEGIEVASFATGLLDLDDEYVVEEPPTSVEPENEVVTAVDVRVETPMTPKHAPAGPSSSDNHNASPFPMPVFGDPSAPDPIVPSGSKHLHQTPPRLVNLPGTPRIILNPHPSPGQPTPVSVSVSTSMLHAISRRVSPFEGSNGPSGLFTPREGELTSVSTGAFGTPSPPHAGLPLLSADVVLASVTTALAEEPRVEIDTPTIEISDSVVDPGPNPARIPTGDCQDGISELAEEDGQLGVRHPTSADDGDDADKGNNQLLSTKPDAGHRSIEEGSMVTSPKSEEIQQAVSTTGAEATVDQNAPPGDGRPEDAQASAETLSANVLLTRSSSLLGSQIDQDPFQSVENNGQAPSGFVPEDNLCSAISQSGLGNFTNVPGRLLGPHSVDELEFSRDVDDQESQMQPSKRKRISEPSSRLTRSMSGKTIVGSKKIQGGHKAERRTPVGGGKRKVLDAKDSGDTGSVSSGASTAVRMLQFASTDGSRASSVVSTAPSDSSSVHHPLIPPPFFHAHGANHHRHQQPAVPPVPVQIHTKAVSPEPSHGPDSRKDSPSVSAIRTPSVQRIPTFTSSPVTRSNCRFHKISLPREEGGPRVCFVVPGCSLGDKELMDEEEIMDHGPATHEDYSRLVGNIEGLDFNPYLIGILRQLVGVDLIRENEVFYLLQPGEETRYKKKGRKSAAGSKLASSTMARSSPISPQVSVASRHSPMTSISRPPVSTAGSIATSIGSSLSEAQSDKLSSLFSVSDEDLSDEEGSALPKSKRRRKEPFTNEGTLADEAESNVPQDPDSKGPRASTRNLKRTRSKRQVGDSAAYKPQAEDEHDSDGGADELDKGRRKAKRKGKKRPRVADEDQNIQVKRYK